MQCSSSEMAPHIYYPVSELKIVKDVTVLKSASVKTMGYFKGDRFHGMNFESLREATDTAADIALDLTYQEIDFVSNKPHLLLGVLFTSNFSPVLLVKAAKELDLGYNDLLKYHNQCLAIRKRSRHFQDLTYIAKKNRWI